MPVEFYDGLAVCLIVFLSAGTAALALDAWGERNPRWVDERIERIFFGRKRR